jgi:hypothetical protein
MPISERLEILHPHTPQPQQSRGEPRDKLSPHARSAFLVRTSRLLLEPRRGIADHSLRRNLSSWT